MRMHLDRQTSCMINRKELPLGRACRCTEISSFQLSCVLSHHACTSESSVVIRESMRMQLDRQLPYELRAVECALSTVTRMLSRECADLEANALHPLERLSHRVSQPPIVDTTESALCKNHTLSVCMDFSPKVGQLCFSKRAKSHCFSLICFRRQHANVVCCIYVFKQENIACHIA